MSGSMHSQFHNDKAVLQLRAPDHDELNAYLLSFAGDGSFRDLVLDKARSEAIALSICSAAAALEGGGVDDCGDALRTHRTVSQMLSAIADLLLRLAARPSPAPTTDKATSRGTGDASSGLAAEISTIRAELRLLSSKQGAPSEAALLVLREELTARLRADLADRLPVASSQSSSEDVALLNAMVSRLGADLELVRGELGTAVLRAQTWELNQTSAQLQRAADASLLGDAMQALNATLGEVSVAVRNEAAVRALMRQTLEDHAAIAANTSAQLTLLKGEAASRSATQDAAAASASALVLALNDSLQLRLAAQAVELEYLDSSYSRQLDGLNASLATALLAVDASRSEAMSAANASATALAASVVDAELRLRANLSLSLAELLVDVAQRDAVLSAAVSEGLAMVSSELATHMASAAAAAAVSSSDTHALRTETREAISASELALRGELSSLSASLADARSVLAGVEQAAALAELVSSTSRNHTDSALQGVGERVTALEGEVGRDVLAIGARIASLNQSAADDLRASAESILAAVNASSLALANANANTSAAVARLELETQATATDLSSRLSGLLSNLSALRDTFSEYRVELKDVTLVDLHARIDAASDRCAALEPRLVQLNESSAAQLTAVVLQVDSVLEARSAGMNSTFAALASDLQLAGDRARAERAEFAGRMERALGAVEVAQTRIADNVERADADWRRRHEQLEERLGASKAEATEGLRRVSVEVEVLTRQRYEQRYEQQAAEAIGQASLSLVRNQTERLEASEREARGRLEEVSTSLAVLSSKVDFVREAGSSLGATVQLVQRDVMEMRARETPAASTEAGSILAAVGSLSEALSAGVRTVLSESKGQFDTLASQLESRRGGAGDASELSRLLAASERTNEDLLVRVRRLEVIVASQAKQMEAIVSERKACAAV